MARKPMIGVMGRGNDASAQDAALAEQLGELIALEGWILLTGGRDVGVMHAANRGAKKVPGSTTVGILPSASGGASQHVDIAIFTGMGDARDAINVLSSDVVVICGSPGAGTAAEAALALKAGRPVILLCPTPEASSFFASLSHSLQTENTPSGVIRLVQEQLASTVT